MTHPAAVSAPETRKCQCQLTSCLRRTKIGIPLLLSSYEAMTKNTVIYALNTHQVMVNCTPKLRETMRSGGMMAVCQKRLFGVKRYNGGIEGKLCNSCVDGTASRERGIMGPRGHETIQALPMMMSLTRRVRRVTSLGLTPCGTVHFQAFDPSAI